MKQFLCGLFLFLSFYPAAQAQYTISTLAGGVSGDGKVATSLALPAAEIAVDGSGNVYFAAFYEARVYKLNANGTLTLVAGNGSQGFSGDNGPAINASLNFPNSIALDPSGNLYIADSGNNRVRKVSNGTITTVAGNGTASFSGDNGPATSASLNYPLGLAFDSNSNLYIVDLFNNRIRKVTNGTITTFAGTGTAGFAGDNGPAASAQLNSPRRIAVDGAGNVYIADASNQRIRKVSGGTITTVAGNGTAGFSGDNGQATSASLNAPTGVSVDSTGANIYIADNNNNRVRKVNGGVITTIAGNGTAAFSGDGGPPTSASLSHPLQVVVDNSGSVYIQDANNNRIRKLGSSGISTIAGGGTSGDGGPAASAGLTGPYGVTVDSSGNVYIADTSIGRIRKISNGTITTVAGNGLTGYTGDNGPATSAALNTPQSVVVDNSGNLYIADSQNSVIRKVANGTITTVAGNGVATFAGDNGPATSASLNQPLGLAVDNAGNLYIADTYNQRIRKVSNGTITTVAGNGTVGFSGDNGPATSAQLNYPQTIVLDNSGNLYIVDYQNNRIRRVSGGTITTVAGGGGLLGDGGAAVNASLLNPEGAVVDATGDLFISDTFNHRVRAVSAGIISTIAGNGTGGFSGDGGAANSAEIDHPVQLAMDSSGKIYVADANNSRIRVLTPAPAPPPPSSCVYTVTPVASSSFTFVNNSFLAFNPGGGNALFTVATAAGCSWNTVSSSSFLQITGGGSVTGGGQVAFTVAANPGPARSGAIVVAGQTFLVSQAQSAGSVNCVANGGVPPITRAEALSDEFGDVIFNCQGSFPANTPVDIQAFFNTNVSSRFLNTTNNASEALLLVNEPSNPVIGTNAFPGLVVSANSVLFKQVPLPAVTGQQTFTLRLTNVRLNGAALGVSSTMIPTTAVASLVATSVNTPVLVNNATQIVAFIQTGIVPSKGSQTPGPDPTTQVGFPLNFQEAFANALKQRLASGQDPSQPGMVYNTESGFVNSSVFGPVVGFADTGTRLLARFTNIPSGLRLFAEYISTSSSSSSVKAQLVAADANGAGGTFYPLPIPRTSTSAQEITIVNGAASATWEITAADPAAIETAQVFIYFQAVGGPPTQAQLSQIGVKLSAAPISSINTSSSTAPVPRFVDTSVAQPLVTVKVISQLKYTGSTPGPPEIPVSGYRRKSVAPGSNISFVSTIQNLGNVAAQDVVVHDNLPSSLLQYNSCTLDQGQACQASGNDLRIPLAGDLLPGQSRVISINATVKNASDGTLGLNTISVTSDLANTDLGSSTVPFVISNCSTCVSLTAGTSPSGLSFMVDGTVYTQTAVQPVTAGMSHVLSVDSNPQTSNNTQYRFAGWSNGVATPSQLLLVTGAMNVTANFISPTLSIQSTHAGSFALGQSNATYSLTVSNTGTDATSSAVSVTENLPAGLTLVGMSGTGWNCTANSCTRSDVLNPGASYPLIVVKVSVSQTASSPQLNQVSVSGGSAATANTSDSTVIVAPTLSLSRSSLNFGIGAAASSPQPVALSFSNGGSLNWTASSNQSNVKVSPTSGTGNTILQVSATQGSSGTITVTAPGAIGSPKQITVNVSSATSAAPFGSFDTPANNATGLAGAIAITGWALDNVEVTSVGIWREPVPGETPSGNGLVLIGNAPFVADARPDVQAGYPNTPFNYRAGWGYLLLTSFLPNNNGGAGGIGNGTYKLHVILTNSGGQTTDLGTHTIGVDNQHAMKPFGTIDTPAQGDTIGGAAYVNFGWSLTQQPFSIPNDGSTVLVYVDGVKQPGHATYNNFRNDIATLFPGYANSMGAVGYYVIDTTALANSVHTIFWIVTDSGARADGIGSRYFNVFNTASSSTATAPDPPTVESIQEGVRLRQGFDPDAPINPVSQDTDGNYVVTMEQLGRIELTVGAARGYMQTGDEQKDLPIGSTLKGGVFYWQALPGFLGEYALVFERPDGAEIRVKLRVQARQ